MSERLRETGPEGRENGQETRLDEYYGLQNRLSEVEAEYDILSVDAGGNKERLARLREELKELTRKITEMNPLFLIERPATS